MQQSPGLSKYSRVNVMSDCVGLGGFLCTADTQISQMVERHVLYSPECKHIVFYISKHNLSLTTSANTTKYAQRHIAIDITAIRERCVWSYLLSAAIPRVAPEDCTFMVSILSLSLRMLLMKSSLLRR